jgi:hypothetical protein
MKKLINRLLLGRGVILSAGQDALVFSEESKHGDIPERQPSNRVIMKPVRTNRRTITPRLFA